MSSQEQYDSKKMFTIILALAWPTMLEQLLQTAVQYIDTADADGDFFERRGSNQVRNDGALHGCTQLVVVCFVLYLLCVRNVESVEKQLI